jgi:hypothetical protein
MMNWLIKSFLILLVISLATFLAVRTIDKDNGFINEIIVNDNTDEQDDDEEKISIIDGYKAIELDVEVSEASGLKFESLKSISIRPEFIAYAEVVDIQPLLSLKTDHQILLAERKALQNNLYSHNKILERAEALHKVKSLSTRDLEKSRFERDQKASELNAVNTRINGFVFKVKSNWGEILSNLIFDKEQQDEFDEVASQRKALILLSLPKTESLDYQNQTVFVSGLNKRESAQKVSYLDQAKQVNNPLYGESYFYLLDSQKVRSRMRLFAWIEESGNISEGYFITDKAVIWYANEPWIYVKHGEALFIRKPLGKAKKIDNGWLLEDKMLVGDDLVVTEGGQTLLSEEFKWAIPDENDD